MAENPQSQQPDEAQVTDEYYVYTGKVLRDGKLVQTWAQVEASATNVYKIELGGLSWWGKFAYAKKPVIGSVYRVAVLPDGKFYSAGQRAPVVVGYIKESAIYRAREQALLTSEETRKLAVKRGDIGGLTLEELRVEMRSASRPKRLAMLSLIMDYLSVH